MAQSLDNLSRTWSDAGTTFTAVKYNVTDTASNAASLLMDLQVGGASKFSVRKDGLVVSASGARFSNFNLGTSGASTWFALAPTGAMGWFVSDVTSGTFDLSLFRDAANTLAQRNGANGQTFRIYNTYTDVNTYERLALYWLSNNCWISTENLGVGTSLRSLNVNAAGINLRTGGTSRWQIDASGHFIGGADNTYDIGASGANRPRTIYAAADIFCGGQMGPTASRLWGNGVTTTGYVGFASSNPLAPDTTLTRVAAGIVGVRDGTTGGAAVSLVEQTAPAAPAANGVYIYAEDDGAGKTRLMARFATGAAVQIAIEP